MKEFTITNQGQYLKTYGISILKNMRRIEDFIYLNEDNMEKGDYFHITARNNTHVWTFRLFPGPGQQTIVKNKLKQISMAIILYDFYMSYKMQHKFISDWKHVYENVRQKYIQKGITPFNLIYLKNTLLCNGFEMSRHYDAKRIKSIPIKIQTIEEYNKTVQYEDDKLQVTNIPQIDIPSNIEYIKPHKIKDISSIDVNNIFENLKITPNRTDKYDINDIINILNTLVTYHETLSAIFLKFDKVTLETINKLIDLNMIDSNFINELNDVSYYMMIKNNTVKYDNFLKNIIKKINTLQSIINTVS